MFDGSKSMTGDLNMGDKTIIGLSSSSQDDSVMTLGNTKAVFLPHNGSRAMTGNVNMGGNEIMNIKPFVEDDDINQEGHVID